MLQGIIYQPGLAAHVCRVEQPWGKNDGLYCCTCIQHACMAAKSRHARGCHQQPLALHLVLLQRSSTCGIAVASYTLTVWVLGPRNWHKVTLSRRSCGTSATCASHRSRAYNRWFGTRSSIPCNVVFVASYSWSVLPLHSSTACSLRPAGDLASAL